MLRNKIVGAFVAVWCAICLSYMGVRTALGALVGGSSAAELAQTSTEQVVEQTTTSEQGAPDAIGQSNTSGQLSTDSNTEPVGNDPTDSGAGASTEPVSTTQDTAGTTQSDAVQSETVAQQESSTDTQDVPDTLNAPASDEQVYAEESPFIEDQSTQDAQADQDTPTLDEYLSQYTCGSCRRNCSLANPRCHNGSRLADAKAQEYYDIYGS